MKIQKSELARFKELDAIVDKSIPAWAEIQKRELWKSGGFSSFKDYCQSKGKSYQTVWNLIQFEKVQRALPDIKIPNTKTAKVISKIPLPQRRKIVSDAMESNGGKLTSTAVKKAMATLPKRGIEAKKQLDGTGIEIPPELVLFWNRNDEVADILSSISSVRVILEKAQESRDRLFRMIDIQGTVSRLKMCAEEIASAKSYAVCPECNGLSYSDCAQCKGRGTLSKFHWGMIAEQTKNLRSK